MNINKFYKGKLNTKTTDKKKRKAQTSMEFMMIVVFVVIVVLIVAIVYLKTATKSSKIGSSSSILAVGENPSNDIVIAFSSPLPSNETSGTISVGSNTYSVGLTGPIYVNNYPEYTSNSINSIVTGNVVNYYESSSSSVSILPTTNMTVQSVATDVIQP